jgi:hypothetical protein
MAQEKRQHRRDWDSPWKETLHHFFRAVLAFFFPDLHDGIDWSKGYEALDKEFQQIVADARAGRGLADKLFKVWRTDGREVWLLVHVEVQARAERRFGRRMFRYNIRCFELYDRPVVSLAILCDDRPTWRPRGFSYGGWGSRTGIRFPTVKLLDYADRAAELAASTNPVAQVVLAHLEARATRNLPEGRRAAKVRLVKGLYDRGWSAADVRQLFRLIDWLMELPKELQESFRQELHEFEEERQMSYVTSIERLAKEEGAREELIRTIRTGLKDRFGSAGVRLMSKVRALDDLRRLRALARGLIKAESLEAFRALLD